MPNKVKFGLSNLHYAVGTTAADGSMTYATPVRIPGAVNMTMDPQGDTTPFYADDIVYFTSTANNGYQGTLEVALLPDDFKKDVLGEEESADGVFIEKAGVTAKEIALLFEFNGDVNAIRHAFFRVACGRPSVTGSTKQANIEPQTETLNITAMPRINDHVVKARCPHGSTAYANWYNAVYTI